MTHDADYIGNTNPAIITKLFGEDYEGPFSDFDEWHATELGLLAGLWAASPEFAVIATAFFGVKSISQLLDGSLKRQVRHEPHYFGGSAFISYLVVSVLEGAPLSQVLEYAHYIV